MIKRNVLTSPRLKEMKKRKRRVFWRKVFLITFGFLVIIGIFSYVSRNAKVNIYTVEISGNEIIDTKLIKEIVDEKLIGYYLKLFPKTNFLLYPKGAIKDELGNRFKRLKNISFELKDINTLKISVAERTALYTWCGENLPELNMDEQTCYFLDESGFIFDEAPYFSGEVYLRFYGLDGINLENPAGFYFSRKIFNNLITFKKNIEEMGLKPRAFYVSGDGEVKMLLSIAGARKNPEIIFKADTDFNKVAENLQAALDTEPLLSKFKIQYSFLQYIDLRFGNKVYYKFSR